MERKAETKPRTRFSVFGKTREDGRARRDVPDGRDRSRFHDTPPYFIVERYFQGCRFGPFFSFWF